MNGLGVNLLLWVLLIAAFVVTLIASGAMNSTIAKYRQIGASSGLTGAQTAQQILSSAGIGNEAVLPISGSLTDHYDPSQKTVSLAEESYQQTSIAAVAIAAHECGHAVQDAQNYAPLRMRTAIVPAANLGSALSWPLILIGLFFSLPVLATAGIVLFSLVVLFQLVTLPVEFDASRRGLQMLRSNGIVTQEELGGARKVLTAAAMTYVAALASSVLQLIRIIILANGNRRD